LSSCLVCASANSSMRLFASAARSAGVKLNAANFSIPLPCD
jgi:hypothetical protein